ncbi:MAG TPA: hypothetical protein VKY39_03880 [Aggregatilineales bacterium]|nr:hypothetical protein [Aggregatilineales bacterium]
MLRGNKPEGELRFELFTWGLVLVVGAIIYVTLHPILPGLLLFIPGLILLGSAIYQDMQPGWTTGWLTYLLAIIIVATGLAWLIDSLLGPAIRVPWLIIAAVELGALLIAKALYDPPPR